MTYDLRLTLSVAHLLAERSHRFVVSYRRISSIFKSRIYSLGQINGRSTTVQYYRVKRPPEEEKRPPINFWSIYLTIFFSFHYLCRLIIVSQRQFDFFISSTHD